MTTETAPTRVLSDRDRRRSMFLAGGVTVVGGLLVWLFLAPLGQWGGLVKFPALAGTGVLVFAGYTAAGRRVWGADWDAGYWFSCAWLAVLFSSAVLADVLPLAEHVDITKSLAEPGNASPDLISSHPLGTNNLSLDLLARSLFGARVSLLTSLLAVSLGLIVGGALGMAAGFFGGWLDRGVEVVTNTLLAFPALILLIALAAVLGRPTSIGGAVLKTGVALAIVVLPVLVRLARTHTLLLRQREFVIASEMLGARRSRILLTKILPNVAIPLLAYAVVLLAVMIVAEGSLAFLGLGLAQPQPTWGNMIAEGGLRTLVDHPHIPLVPGAFMFLTVLSLNRVGERVTAGGDARVSHL